mmetsp:Transcript_50593/g.108034  ORF Transcript_50593/g.108034 Transcript_50593/m.108034 type:complete len:191 (-) Transcript_50593:237-809(-)
MLVFTIICTMRLLGLRLIAISQLVALGLIGSGTLAIGVVSRGDMPNATTWLLLGCGIVQILCCMCGLIGFKRKNRECVRWLFIILAMSTTALVYIAISTHKVVRDTTPETPEMVLLVFGIAVVNSIFNSYTFIFDTLWYCRTRKEFTAHERSLELPVHYSNNHLKYTKNGRRGRGKGRKGGFEYNPRSAL